MVTDQDLNPGNACPECGKPIKSWSATYEPDEGECRLPAGDVQPPGLMSGFAGDYIAIFHET